MDIGFIAIFASAIRFINARFSHHIVHLPCEPEWLRKPFRFNG